MDCQSAEKLLTLYVRADLDTKSQSAVSAHLQSCPGCRQLADDHKELQQWMRLYQPPEFTGEFFAGIRQNVLGEIARRPTARRWAWLTSLPELFKQPLHQRIIVTASVSLFIILSAIALTLNRTKSDAGSGSVAVVEMKNEKSSAEINKGQGQQTTDTTTAVSTREEVSGPSRVSRSNSLMTLAALKRATRKRSDEAVRRNSNETQKGETLVAKVTNATPAPVFNATSGQQTSSVDSGATASLAPLRVEIQTSDPNVRIIWFASHGKQSLLSK
jgi:hypothetical protein